MWTGTEVKVGAGFREGRMGDPKSVSFKKTRVFRGPPQFGSTMSGVSREDEIFTHYNV